LAICVAVGKLYTAGELYIAGELCGSGRAALQWASYVAVGKLCGQWQAVWQWARGVTVGKLYTVGAAGELYIAGKVCGSGQAVRQWLGLTSDPVLAQVSQWPTFAGFNISHKALSGHSRPSNKLHPDLTSSTVHKAALACVPKALQLRPLALT